MIARYMDEHGIDVHCLVPLPWLECEPELHANETKALKVHNHVLYDILSRIFYYGCCWC